MSPVPVVHHASRVPRMPTYQEALGRERCDREAGGGLIVPGNHFHDPSPVHPLPGAEMVEMPIERQVRFSESGQRGGVPRRSWGVPNLRGVPLAKGGPHRDAFMGNRAELNDGLIIEAHVPGQLRPPAASAG